MRSLRTVLIGLACGLLVATTSGCGKNGFKLVKGAGLKSHVENGASYGQVTIVIDTGSVQMPAIELPILDPRHPDTVYGSVALKPRLDGKTDVVVDVNLTQVAEVPGEGAILPNGKPLPVGGLDGARVITLPVGHTGIRIYVAIDTLFGGGGSKNAVAMIGVALPFSEFNGLGNALGNVSFFLPFEFNKVRGIGGIFTGTQSSQSGLGLFVDLSGLVPAGTQQLASAGYASFAMKAAVVAPESISPRQLQFYEIKPSNSKRQAIENHMYRMHVRRTRVHLQ